MNNFRKNQNHTTKPSYKHQISTRTPKSKVQ